MEVEKKLTSIFYFKKYLEELFMKKRTNEEFLKELTNLNNSITALDKYIDNKTKIRFRCRYGHISITTRHIIW